MSEAIPVTVSTARNALSGLPLTARLTLSFVARLQRGTLEVSLPNGRRLRFGGVEPGPAAVMIINDLGFDHRGGGLFMAYLQAKERLAQKVRTTSLSELGIGRLP